MMLLRETTSKTHAPLDLEQMKMKINRPRQIHTVNYFVIARQMPTNNSIEELTTLLDS